MKKIFLSMLLLTVCTQLHGMNGGLTVLRTLAAAARPEQRALIAAMRAQSTTPGIEKDDQKTKGSQQDKKPSLRAVFLRELASGTSKGLGTIGTITGLVSGMCLASGDMQLGLSLGLGACASLVSSKLIHVVLEKTDTKDKEHENN